ncbi:MAG TPA: DUF2071 domain-containing protein [Solirubrobacteraceae bacterium]|nr:DUF2071 domain-containing protein [Solirubrobacteraceae bacterium]
MTVKKPVPAFLTAQWLYVLGVTYAVDAALLAEHLPRGAEIDSLEGSPRVSIVAFHFRRTRLRGVPIPLHVNFGEINLRFYVRLHDRRAVVFIREFVSRPAIAVIAKLTYNEPYRTIRMRDEVLGPDEQGLIGVRHRFGRRLGNRLEAWADPEPVVPAEDSPGYWLTHHDLGVGRDRSGRARSYDVDHPVWALHEVRSLDVEVDFGALYGPQWAFLSDAEPSHVTLAEGSGVSITPAVDA